jgi:hypothetical protein
MIQFRCWHCHKMYRVADDRVGERITCSCQRPVRVPKNSGGSSRVPSVGDWLIEVVLCDGGGAFLGACLAVVIISRFPIPIFFWTRWDLLLVLTLGGFVVGTIAGVRGLEWLGRRIRTGRTDP